MSHCLTYSIFQQRRKKNVPLLDTYGGATVAYSLRKLNSDYTGYCIKVRRSSDDVEQDIGFVAGRLDESSLNSFIGTESAYIVKWYDQSGNNNDATQSIKTGQPRIVLNGAVEEENSLPIINFGTNSNEWYLSLPTGLFYNSSSISYFHCSKITDYASSNTAIFGPRGNGQGFEVLQHTTVSRRSLLRINNVYRNDSNLRKYQLWRDTRYDILSIVGNSSSVNSYNNSIPVLLTNSGALPSLSFNGVYYIGNYATRPYFYGKISEIVIYSSDKSSARNNIEKNIGLYWKIFSDLNNIIYNYSRTEIFYCNPLNTGTLTILSGISTIPYYAFEGCGDYSALSLPSEYDSSVYSNFVFSDFSGESLDTSILAMSDGTTGTHKKLYISPTSLSNLLSYNADAVTDAAARYIDIYGFYILTQYTGAAAAWSLRLLKSDYSGNCIKVRRSSDNAEQDIGFVDGILDVDTLLSFVGNGDGYVKTWYDQSGNSNNATQATTTKQPKIVSSGALIKQNGRAALTFKSDGTDSLSFTRISTIRSVFWVVSPTLSGWFSLLGDSNNYDFHSSTTQYFNLTNSSDYIDNGTLYRDGVSIDRNATRTNTHQLLSLFTTGNVNANQISEDRTFSRSFAGTGCLSEIIIYASDKSSDREGIEKNINNFYMLY